MISDETVDQVREHGDIVQVIGDFVNLRRTGTDFRGPCPFHQGTHRNFSVSPKKRMYYCFVCHESGDVIEFVRKRLGLDFPGAVRFVAEKSGIEVREIAARREGPDPNEPLYEALASAAEFFRTQLRDSEEGRAARDYLAMRAIPPEAVERFELGYAPRDGEALRSHLAALGIDDERQLAAGLLSQREESGEVRPRFRGRLMFPILDISARYVGFGGRILGPGEPKYLNSPESAVFSKARLLYALNRSKHAIRREDRALVVEGYFDALRLMSAGIEYVVAPLGTALTDAQAVLLARYTKNVFLLYDSDAAGLKATFRAGDELLRNGVAVQVVTLPDGEDPDDFVKSNGSEALLERMNDSLDLFERKIQLLDRGGWFSDIQRKRRAIDKLLPTIRATSDPLRRDLYIGRVSEASGVRKSVLDRELALAAIPSGSSPPPVEIPHGNGPPPPPDVFEQKRREYSREPGLLAQRTLVRAMLQDRAQIEPICTRIGAEELANREYAEIFRALLDDPEIELEKLVEGLSSEAAFVIDRALEEGIESIMPLREHVEGSVRQLLELRLRGDLERLDEQMRIASEDEKNDLLRQKMALANELRQLGSRYHKSVH